MAMAAPDGWFDRGDRYTLKDVVAVVLSTGPRRTRIAVSFGLP